MSQSINPIIHGQLLAFRGRFRWLQFLRGASAGLIVFLGGLLLLACADWFFVMEDRTRWMLSGGVYFVALIVGWFACVRPLLRVLDERTLAAMIEEEAPELRKELLSAVELAGDDEGMDSPVFRKKLQDRVASRIQRVQMDGLLPSKRVRRWVVGAGMVLAVVAGLASTGSGRQLLLRALAPTANLERVSRNRIVLLAPDEFDSTAPEGDTVSIRVQVTGPALETAPRLITEFSDGTRQEISMDGDAANEGEFTSAISMTADLIEYQVHAGDAVSRWYTLRSRRRPHVISFTKVYHFPKYSGRKPVTLREEAGDLTALSGTEVELTVYLDQPVAEAALHIQTATSTNTFTLTNSASPREWSRRITLTENGAYTVHVATGEGLENKHRAQYSLTAQPDLVPQIRLTAPAKDVTARPEDILQIIGEAEDDVGLRELHQLVRVNTGAWTTNAIPIPQMPATNHTVQLDWDLLKLNAKPGDIVLTKLVAIDHAGNRAETRAVTLTLDSALFEATRVAALNDQRNWVTVVNAAADATTKFTEIFPNDLDAMLLPGSDVERRDKAAKAVTALAAVQSTWALAGRRLPTALRKVHAGREAAGLTLLGRVGGRLELDWLPRAKLQLTPLQTAPVVDPKVKAHSAGLADLLKDITAANNRVRRAANAWLAADEAAVALDLLDYVSRAAVAMHRLAENEKDPKAWERLARRQASVTKEIEVAEAVLGELAKRLTGEADKVTALQTQLKTARESLVEKLKAPPEATLLPAGRALGQAVTQAANTLRPLADKLGKQAATARAQLEKSNNGAAGAIRQVRAAVLKRQQTESDLAKAKKDNKPFLKPAANDAFAQARLEHEWKAAQSRLRRRALLEEARRESDPAFVSDTSRAAAALGAVRAGLDAGRAADAVAKQLNTLADAMHTLEVAHQLALIEAAIKALSHRERWETKATDANSLRPRDWQWLRQQLSATPQQLRDAGLEGAAELEAAARGGAADAIGEEMKGRTKNPGVFLIEKSKKSH
ncbi:MAG TPA: hypothetical protein EYQ62_04735 [Verrucomicrobiales bacterium]|nr:hypothetical protein [Verrucomicrobiales bacterium]HIL23994.1 hypothetical protein [Verrucomicrobiota bacterium]